MERDLLKAWLDRGLSLPQIGKLVGRDPSTVGYWVQKHGLVANGSGRYAPRGGLARDQLAPLVEEGATLREMADRLDRSISTVRYWLARYGLKAGGGHRSHRRACRRADVAGLTQALAECDRHGTVQFVRRGDGGWTCPQCRAENVVNWRRRAKARLLREAGGRCRLCGYSRYQGALQFHHLDPSSKEFAISRRGVTRAFEELRAEARKCVLLCSNCHAEVEAGHATI
jgi:transposase